MPKQQVPVEVTRDVLGWLLVDSDGHPIGEPTYYKTKAAATRALKTSKDQPRR